MLYKVSPDKLVTTIPYKREYDIWRSRLTNEEYGAILEELNEKVSSNEIHTSSWIPGSDWTGTVYEPIYTKACNHDQETAAKCFGLFLWVVMMERPEKWSFGHYELHNLPIKGLTYFRIDL